MYCEECGKKLDTDDELCPECRKKLEEEQKSKGSEKKTEDISTKEFILKGQRRRGTIVASKVRYESQVLICGDQIEVNTKYYKFKEGEYRFTKQDIDEICGKIKPMWSLGDIIRFLVFGLMIPVTKWQSIWGILWSIKLMICNCIEIRLKDGRKVCIPVIQYADINPVLMEIGGQQEKIKKFLEKQIPEENWQRRNTVSTYLIAAVAAVMIAQGTEEVRNQWTLYGFNHGSLFISDKEREVFDTLLKNTTFKKEEDEDGNPLKYEFDYQGKWIVEYEKDKSYIRFPSQEVHDCFAGCFSETAAQNIDSFTYGFDTSNSSINIFIDTDMDEGHIDAVMYDWVSGLYTVMVDGEKYEITASFKEYLEKYGLAKILRAGVDAFEADMDAMGMMRDQLGYLSVKNIAKLEKEREASGDLNETKKKTQTEEPKEQTVTETESETEPAAKKETKKETEKITEVLQSELLTETEVVTEAVQTEKVTETEALTEIPETKTEEGTQSAQRIQDKLKMAVDRAQKAKQEEIQTEIPQTEQSESEETATEKMTEAVQPDYYSAYAGILSDTKNEYGDAGSYCTYALYDIDGDGVKELITGEGTCSADWGNYVYSISSNGVYCAGYFDKTVLLYAADDGNGIYAVWGMQGVEQVRRITLVDEKVKEEEILYRQIKPDYESYATYPITIQTAYMTDFSLLTQNEETQVSGESQPEEMQGNGYSDYYSEAEYLEVTEEDLLRRPEQYEDMDIKVLTGAHFVDEDGFDTMESIQVQYYGKAYDKSGELIGNILSGDYCWVEGQFLSYTKDDGEKEWYIAAHKVIVVDGSEYWSEYWKEN